MLTTALSQSTAEQRTMQLTLPRILQLTIAVICLIAGLSWSIEVIADGWLRWALSALVVVVTCGACSFWAWYGYWLIIVCCCTVHN